MKDLKGRDSSMQEQVFKHWKMWISRFFWFCFNFQCQKKQIRDCNYADAGICFKALLWKYLHSPLWGRDLTVRCMREPVGGLYSLCIPTLSGNVLLTGVSCEEIGWRSVIGWGVGLHGVNEWIKRHCFVSSLAHTGDIGEHEFTAESWKSEALEQRLGETEWQFQRKAYRPGVQASHTGYLLYYYFR